MRNRLTALTVSATTFLVLVLPVVAEARIYRG
jgi:hypothetical protein